MISLSCMENNSLEKLIDIFPSGALLLRFKYISPLWWQSVWIHPTAPWTLPGAWMCAQKSRSCNVVVCCCHLTGSSWCGEQMRPAGGGAHRTRRCRGRIGSSDLEGINQTYDSNTFQYLAKEKRRRIGDLIQSCQRATWQIWAFLLAETC